MNLQGLLDSYPRYREISQVVDDNMVFRFAAASGVTEAEFIKGMRDGDLGHQAIYLHAKEELFQILKNGITIEEAVRDKDSGVAIIKGVYNDAFNEATRVEYNFLRHVAATLGYDLSIEALGIANPLFLGTRRGLVLSSQGLELMKAGLLEHHPSTEELAQALEFYKKAGLDCEHTAEDIALGLRAVWGW